jgi:hypothetical protein
MTEVFAWLGQTMTDAIEVGNIAYYLLSQAACDACEGSGRCSACQGRGWTRNASGDAVLCRSCQRPGNGKCKKCRGSGQA